MVNSHNPTAIMIVNEYLVLTKLNHVVGGSYIWEFLTTLDYEWSVIRGHRPYRRTIWIYSFTRLTTLISVILILVAINATSPINCQAWVTSSFVFSYLALSASLLVIVLRTIAIWNKKKVVVILATCIWCIYFTFLIEGVTQLRSTWLFGDQGCTLPNIKSNKLAIITMFVADILLLPTMLLGLHRLRDRAGRMFGLARLLWKQGVMWLLIATGAGLTTVVLLCSDLNPPLDIMFLVPTLVIMTITATRMYTSLADSSFSADIVKGSDLQEGSTHRAIVPRAELLPQVHVTYEHHTIVTINECTVVQQTTGTEP